MAQGQVWEGCEQATRTAAEAALDRLGWRATHHVCEIGLGQDAQALSVHTVVLEQCDESLQCLGRVGDKGQRAQPRA